MEPADRAEIINDIYENIDYLFISKPYLITFSTIFYQRTPWQKDKTPSH